MHKTKLILLAIVAFSFLIRIWNINIVPPSLNWDEVSHGYNAYSILRTGKDEWGVTLPHIFRAYGDYKLPVYIYLTVLSEFFLGLNALAVRLPSILSGTFSVALLYFLVQKLFKNKSMALLSALLMGIVPWSLFLSRIAVEANVALFLIISGVYFFVIGLKNNKYLLLSALFLGLSVWTYNSARIFTPLLIIILFLIYRGQLLRFANEKRKLTVACFLLVTVLFAPMFIQLGQDAGLARYENVRILDQGAIAKIGEYRNKSGLSADFSRIIFNKATYFIYTFATNYAKHFTPNFIFLEGGQHYQFSVPGFGLMYFVNLPFFLVGLYILISRHKKSPEGKLILAWLLLGPVAASLTRESPHVLRSIVMLPAVVIITGVGASHLSQLSKKNLFTFIFLAALFVSFADYFNYYLTDYRQKYSWSWQYGYKEVVDYIKPRYDDYEKIVITKKYGEPHEFLLFNLAWEPSRFQADSSRIQFNKSNWFWTDKFDKFYFVNDWDIPRTSSEFITESKVVFDCASCLLVTSPGNAPENWKKVQTINFLDNTPAFEIYEH